jgi:arylsulfatase A-like enzyme
MSPKALNRVSRRTLLKQTAGVVLASKARVFGNLVPDSVQKPNVILMMADDLGWWDFRINGNPTVETPNLDRLAREGVRLTHFYVSPVCQPTRAALLTGRHYQRTGAVDRILDREPMNLDEVTLGNLFQQKGYQTALIGKWHLGRYMKYHPNNRGFGEFFGFWQGGFINHYFDSDELFHNKQPILEARGYITDILTDQAIRFLRQNATRPFFLYQPYNAVHVPHLVPDSYVEKYLAKNVPLDQAKIYGMVSSLDENVGRLLSVVGELGIAERTIVIFMSDNGGIGQYFRAGLRGGKGSVYEGGVRVPFIARWPKRFPGGVVLDCEAQHIDILPTLCDLTGIDLPSERHLDGKSIAPALTQGVSVSPHKYIFHQWHRLYGPRTGPDRCAILDVQRGYKLVVPHPEDLNADWDEPEKRFTNVGSPYELFDIRQDPGETRDLSPKLPDVVADLRKRYEEWYADVTAGQTDPRAAPIEVGRSDENPVRMSSVWGEPVGKTLQFTFHNYTGDTFDHWSEVGDYVRWKIHLVQPGHYEVTIQYACPPGDAGSRFTVNVGDAKLEHTVEATPGPDVLVSRNIGTLLLKEGPAFLEVRPTSIAGKQLMALHELWLRRV